MQRIPSVAFLNCGVLLSHFRVEKSTYKDRKDWLPVTAY